MVLSWPWGAPGGQGAPPPGSAGGGAFRGARPGARVKLKSGKLKLKLKARPAGGASQLSQPGCTLEAAVLAAPREGEVGRGEGGPLLEVATAAAPGEAARSDESASAAAAALLVDSSAVEFVAVELPPQPARATHVLQATAATVTSLALAAPEPPAEGSLATKPPAPAPLTPHVERTEGLQVATAVPATVPWSLLSVHGHLGGGAFGEIFAASLRLRSGRSVPVALKRPFLAGCNEADKAFREEASVHAAASAARHDTICRLLGVTSNPPALVLERARCSLRRALAEHGSDRPLPLRRVLRVARGVTAALAHLHTLGICHRDLTSMNVLVGAEWNPKLCDFGLSRRDGHISSSTGAAAWAAPEVLRGAGAGDGDGSASAASADVFSLGVILWELLSGATPWVGLSAMQIIMRVAVDGATLPTVAEARLRGSPARRELAALSQRCMAHEAAERPPLGDVRRTLAGVAKQVRASSTRQRTALAAA